MLVVQEEIEKAKAGGGWLKGRLRKNPQTEISWTSFIDQIMVNYRTTHGYKQTLQPALILAMAKAPSNLTIRILMQNFLDIGLPQPLLASLKQMQY